MSDDLVQFLRDRLDETERIARRAASYDDGASHDVQGPEGTWVCLDESEWFGDSYRGGVIAPRVGYANAPQLGAHIARHDPARVLADVEAKRRLLKLHSRVGDLPFCTTCDAPSGVPGKPQGCDTLRLLVVPYADHPDYRAEWRAGEDTA